MPRTDPALSGTYPDPSVMKVGGDYYLVTSTFEYFPGLPIFHSTDLETWTQVGHVIDRVDQLDLSTVASSGGLFAPTIRHDGSRFYVTCTLVGGEGRQGNFVVTADAAGGPWSDPVWLDDAPGIDPSLFFDGDGRAWYTGTHLTVDPPWHDQTTVWLRELDVTTLQLTGPTHELWHGALIGAVWAEGPHLYAKDGWYYLLASEGGTEFNHALSVARSRSVTGPYEGFPGNPVLTHRHLGHSWPITNVGHADLVETPDGGWAATLLATRPYGGYHANLGRETFLVDVSWEDDWPVFAPGIGQVVVSTPAAGIEPRMPASVEWTRLRTADTGFALVDEAAASVTLDARPTALDAIGTPSFLGVRQRHRDAIFAATIGTTTTLSGLVARQSEAANLFLARLGDSVTLLRGNEVLASFAVSGDVRLTLSIRGQDYTFSAGDQSVTVDGRFLSSQSAGGFVGVWFGLAAIGEAGSSTVFRDVNYGGH